MSQKLFDSVPLVDKTDNHLFVNSVTSLRIFKTSLESASNISSSILLNDVWNSNEKLLQGNAMDVITNSAHKLLENVDTSKVKTWKSSLSTFTEPEALFMKSIQCTQCTSTTPQYVGLSTFLNNECKCDLGVTNKKNEHIIDKDTSENMTSLSKQDRQVIKPKFGRFRSKNSAQTWPETVDCKTNQPETSRNLPNPIQEVDLEKEEDENKVHRSNVAKITFKTAREQLLASNPAAKRTLGASRKAHAKFVSPMIGVQEKQESAVDLEAEKTDERLKHIDPKMIELIESEIIDRGSPIGWEDIAGLQMAKSVIQEAVVWPLLRPDIFTGLRRPPKGILLFGPPGTGKTLIGKCVAAQCHATFFSISASSLTSKWIGDGEKMVRALFAVARCHQPAVIFIDEIDSLLTQRSDSEHEATRRIKTEFLVQFDGASTGDDDRVLIVGATNRPQELDEAARRRLVKRLYIPLPDVEARRQIVTNLLRNESNELSPDDVSEIARLTEGYSGADMKSLCSEAAMGPIRSVPLSQIVTIDSNKVRPVYVKDFINALQRVRPSVSQDDLGQYVKWNSTYGQGF